MIDKTRNTHYIDISSSYIGMDIDNFSESVEAATELALSPW